eukprot:7132275-Pyramimonas_sp.AAC.1
MMTSDYPLPPPPPSPATVLSTIIRPQFLSPRSSPHAIISFYLLFSITTLASHHGNGAPCKAAPGNGWR